MECLLSEEHYIINKKSNRDPELIMIPTTNLYWEVYFEPGIVLNVCLHFLFLKRFYLFICQREIVWEHKQREAGRGWSRLPTEQGAWCGTQSQGPGIMTWAEGRHSIDWATQVFWCIFIWHSQQPSDITNIIIPILKLKIGRLNIDK